MPIDAIRRVCFEGHRLAGRIRGEDVEASDVTWVRMPSYDGESQTRRFATTDAEGCFAFESLVDGDTILYVHRAGDERFAVLRRVRLPTEDHVVELERGEDIRGRVRGYTGSAGFGLRLLFTWRGPSIPVEVEDDGTLTLTGVPPGPHGIAWQRAGKGGRTDMDVAAGGEDVDVVLPDEALQVGQSSAK